MEFSDGMKFNLDGPRRITLRNDGWYMVGHGMLCPVDSLEEAHRLLRELEQMEADRARPDI